MALNRAEDPWETKRPEPVSLMDEPSFANAEAAPPALTVMGVVLKLTLMRSQRIRWAALAAVALRTIAAEIPANKHGSKSLRFVILASANMGCPPCFDFQACFLGQLE